MSYTKNEIDKLKSLKQSLKIQKRKLGLTRLEQNMLNATNEILAAFEQEDKRKNEELQVRELARQLRSERLKEVRDKPYGEKHAKEMLQLLAGILELNQRTGILEDENQMKKDERQRRLKMKVTGRLLSEVKRIKNSEDEKTVQSIKKELMEDEEEVSEKEVRRLIKELLNE